MNSIAERALETRDRSLSAFERGVALATAAAIGAIWAIAAYLSPDSRGIGTHEQLGLAPCQMITFFDVPCLFCGMTTAFSHLAHGNLLLALITQPAAVVIALLSLPAAAIALFTALRGTLPKPIANLAGSRRLLIAGATVLLTAWFYKIIAYVN